MGNTPQIPGWTIKAPQAPGESPTPQNAAAQNADEWVVTPPQPTSPTATPSATDSWEVTPPAQVAHVALQPTNASAPEGFWDRVKNWASGVWDSAPVQLALALSPHQALRNVYGKLPGPVTQKVSDVLGYPIPGVMNTVLEGAHTLGNTRLIAPVAGTTPSELEKHLPEGAQQTINDIGEKLKHFIQGNATVGGGLQLGGLIAANTIPVVGEAADADAAANIADEASEAASAVKDATEGAAPPMPTPGTAPVADPQSAAEGAANAVKDAVEGTPGTPAAPGAAPVQAAVEGTPQPTAEGAPQTTAPAEATGEPATPEAPTKAPTGETPSAEGEAEEEEPQLRKLKTPQKPPKEFGPLTKAIARSPVGRYLLEHPNLLKAAKYVKSGVDLGFSYEMGKGVINDERGIQEDLKEQNYPKAVADMLGITATGAGAYFGAKEGIGEAVGHVFHADPTALDILRAKHDGDLQLAIAQTHGIAQEITKLHLSPMDQEAVKFYINAGGDKAVLQQWAEQLKNVPSGTAPTQDVRDVALEAIQRALNDTGQIKATADTLTKFLAHIHAEGRAVDYFQHPPRANYFPQGTAWDDENGNPTVIDEEEGAPVKPPKRGGGTLKDVKAPTLRRIFPTYFDGIMAGQRPSYIPLHMALMQYANDVLPSIATRRFVADLRGTDAGDGRPIAVQGGMVLNPTAEEGPALVDPRGMPKPHIVQNGFELPEIGKGEPENEPGEHEEVDAHQEVAKPVPTGDEPLGPRVEPVTGALRARNKDASTLWLSDDGFNELRNHVQRELKNTKLGERLGGIRLSPSLVRRVLQHADLSDDLRDLVTDALNHSDYSKGTGIAALRDSLPEAERNSIEDEEHAHLLQSALSGNEKTSGALTDSKAQRALINQVKFSAPEYNDEEEAHQAAEVGAKLLAGRYGDLGLTKEQGDSLLNRYILELEKEHGETKLREAASRAPQEIGRKITAFLDYRRGGEAPEGAPGAELAQQRPDPIRLLGSRGVRETAREIAAQAHATGAAAFSFKDGLLEPRNGFAVPVYPERTEAFPEGAKPSSEMVQGFLEKNRDIFARDPDATVMVLPHPGQGFSLEISHIEDDRDTAVKTAKENRRAGVLDLQTNKPVPTGIEPPKAGIEYIRSGADRYNKSERLPQIGGENLPSPKNVGQVAEAYEKLKHQPFDAATKTAYDSLRRDIEHQWDFLTKGLGIKMQPWHGEGEPYASPAEMWKDVEKNHRLRFKDDKDILDDHPLYGINPKSGTTYVNMLGALHDVLGRAAAHLGDTLEDRDTAYQRHAQMFSPESRGAFATEIRGRDAAIEAGKDVGPRKAGLLPEELRGRGELDRFPAAKEPIIPKVSTFEERVERAARRNGIAPSEEDEGALAADANILPDTTPSWLRGSKPRFGYRSENYKLDFEDDRDKALYTIAQGTKNKMHDTAMEWLRKQFPGDSDDEIRAKGAAVRERIKKLAATKPNSDTLRVAATGDEIAPAVKQAVEEGGAKVNGKMQRMNGKSPLVLFTDPKTKDTLSLPEDEISKEAVASKLAAKRAQFAEAEKKTTPDAVKEAEQKPVPEVAKEAAASGNGNKPPIEEKPPVAPEEQEPPKPKKGRKAAPVFDTSDYKDINHPSLRKWKFLASRDGNPILLHADMKIHPDFYKAVKNYVEDGGLEHPALRKALQLTTLAKNTKILFAPFHRIQEGARGLISGLGGTVFHPPEIDPDDPVVSRLLHNSLKLYDPQSAADFGSEGLESETFWKKQIKKALSRREGADAKPSFEEATRKWEAEGKKNQAVSKLAQGMGTFLGDGLFGPGGYVPRLKAALAVKEFQEYMEAHPKADPDLVAWQVSHHVNSVFGLMNWKVLGASVKHLDIARLISFAPDFLSSELSLFGGALSGDWRAQKLLLRNAVLQVVATRIATMAFAMAEHPNQTLKNPVAAMNLQHPMSVKLPNGDLLMPRTPLTDAMNFARNPAQFVEYRTSPLLDAARGAAGRDYAGHKLKGVQARAESVASSLEPMFMQGIPKTSSSDSIGKSLLRGLSLDEYTDYTPAQRLAFAYDAGDAADEPKTAEQKQATMQEMKLISGLRPKNLGGRGNLTVADVRQAFKSGKITSKQMLTIMRDAEKPAIVAAVTHLTVPQILKVMSVASPQEGIELVTPLLRKLVGLSTADPQQFRALQPLVRQAIKAARIKSAHELIQH